MPLMPRGKPRSVPDPAGEQYDEAMRQRRRAVDSGASEGVLVDEVVVTAPRRGRRGWVGELVSDIGRGRLEEVGRDLVGVGNAVADRLGRYTRPGAGGGVYGDFGLGIGPGFNLHVDREGVQASAGAGLFGRAKVGYAADREALEAQRQNNRVFAGATVGPAGLGGAATYDLEPGRPVLTGGEVAIGPFKGSIDDEGQPKLDVSIGPRNAPPKPARRISPEGNEPKATASTGGVVELGVDAGMGVLHDLSFRKWRPPWSRR